VLLPCRVGLHVQLRTARDRRTRAALANGDLHDGYVEHDT